MLDMVIDVHAHLYPQAYIAVEDHAHSIGTRIRRLTARTVVLVSNLRKLALGPEFFDLHCRMGWMNRVGIDVQVLSLAPTAPIGTGDLSQKIAADANDGLTKAHLVFTNRFFWLGLLHNSDLPLGGLLGGGRPAVL